MTRFPKVSTLSFVTMTTGLLALLACTNSNGTVTFVDGPMRGRSLVSEELARFHSETTAQDIRAVVMHPKCAKEVSAVYTLSFIGTDGLDSGNDFRLRPTGTVPETAHRRQTFFDLRTSDHAKYQEVVSALDEWSRLAQSGGADADLVSVSVFIDFEINDVTACIPGQNTGSFVLMNSRTGERAVELTLLSEFWD